MLDDRILFIDGEAILLDKPAGLPVDAPRDGGLSVEKACHSLRFGFQRAPTPVHRLDRDTSGCLLLARHPKAHARFAAAFEAGLAVKTYVAVLNGIPEGPEGRIDLSLTKTSTREAGWRIVPDAQGKPAATRWRLLEARDGRALVEFRPETGRTHQLRVHAASGLGCAIVGDPVYGAGPERGGMLLHAIGLAVPRDPKPLIAVTAPLPERFGAWDAFAPDLPDAGV
jgi:tRNA pseudouridine32 synthase/23S rRNA pseudouridine746 synthase